MKNRDYKLFFNDMLECTNSIIDYTNEMSFDDFMQDKKTREAVERNIEIMGEAVRHIPDDIRERFNNIAYRKITGLRNILIHNYLGIDYGIIWEIIKNNLPELKIQVEATLRELNIQK